MGQILLLSTPLNDSKSGIALINEPNSLQRLGERGKKVQAILGYNDQFWRSVGGIIWNPLTKTGTYNSRKGFMVKVPELLSREVSFLDAHNFPDGWTIEQKQKYIDDQITRIMDYTAVNKLWLSGEKDWERGWDRNAY